MDNVDGWDDGISNDGATRLQIQSEKIMFKFLFNYLFLFHMERISSDYFSMRVDQARMGVERVGRGV